jgi:hypothetical protein
MSVWTNVSQNHKVLVSRTEDLEDDMQVIKTDLDVMKIEMSSYRQDVEHWRRLPKRGRRP